MDAVKDPEILAYKNATRRFAVVVISYLCGFSAFFSFLSTYLYRHGYQESDIGILLMIVSACAAVVPILFGWLCDHLVSVKKLVIACLSISIPCVAILFASGGEPWIVVPVVVLMSIFVRSLIPLIDGWAIRLTMRGSNIRFGIARGMGAAGFAIMAAITGALVQQSGIKWMFIIYLAAIAVCIPAMLTMPDIPVGSPIIALTKKPTDETRVLVKNREYLLLVFAVSFSGIGFAFNASFLPLLIMKSGGDAGNIGLAVFIGAFSEFPAMALSDRLLRRYSAQLLLGVSLFFVVLQIFAPLLSTKIVYLITVQALQSISYGLYLPVLLRYVSKIVASSSTTTAIAIIQAFSSGVAGILGNLVGGVLSARYGILLAYAVFSAFAVAGLLLFIMSLTSRNRQTAATYL